MKLILIIGAGSFLGGISRYLLANIIQIKSQSGFPFGTLTVNILGCLLIGLILGFHQKLNISDEWRLFLATGIIGGFTTFSAFSLESIHMLKNDQYLFAFSYILLSLLLGLFATFAGIFIIKYLS